MAKPGTGVKTPAYAARRVPFRRLPPDGFWQVIVALYFVPPLLEHFFLAPNMFLSERMALYAFWLLPLMILSYYLGLRGGLVAAAGILPFFLWRLRLLPGNPFQSVLAVYFALLMVFALCAGLLAEKIIRYAEALIRDNVTDELTGLFEPRFFQQCLDREVDRARRYHTPLSLVLVGFEEHDKTLMVKAARLLQDTVRGADTVARFDNGDFAVILPQTSALNARVFCDRAQQLLNPLGTPYFSITEYDAQSGRQMSEEARRKLHYNKNEGQKTAEQ
jgi:diguanylate cyclase (GGDEF)-like protein